MSLTVMTHSKCHSTLLHGTAEAYTSNSFTSADGCQSKKPHVLSCSWVSTYPYVSCSLFWSNFGQIPFKIEDCPCCTFSPGCLAPVALPLFKPTTPATLTYTTDRPVPTITPPPCAKSHKPNYAI